MTNVQNMLSTSGREVPNQFIIQNDGKLFFQSYRSIIAMKEKGQVTLDEHYWDYSRTTAKYRNMFLGETTADTKRKIASGEYKLADLNS